MQISPMIAVTTTMKIAVPTMPSTGRVQRRVAVVRMAVFDQVVDHQQSNSITVAASGTQNLGSESRQLRERAVAEMPGAGRARDAEVERREEHRGGHGVASTPPPETKFSAT